MAGKKTAKRLRLDDLSPEARAVVKRKVIEGRVGFKSLQHLVSELAAFDAGRDAESERTGLRLTNYFGFALLLGLFAGALAWGREEFPDPRVGFGLMAASGAVAALFAVLAVFYGAKTLRLGRVDLANDFRLLLPGLLEELEEDLGDRGKVRLRVDLSGPTRSKIVSRRKLPSPRFTTLIQTTFRDPWLSMEMPLADGGLVHVKVENIYLRMDRRRWQRSSSGKFKRKRKLKWKKVVAASAGILPAGSYEWDTDKPAPNAAGSKFKRRDRGGRTVCSLARKFKFSREDKPPEQTASPGDVVGMLMELYSMLAAADTGRAR